MVGHPRQTHEHLAEVSFPCRWQETTIEQMMAERWLLKAGIGVAAEEPVFSVGRGSAGVCDEVVVEAAFALAQMRGERFTVIEPIRAGIADERSGQMARAQLNRELPQPTQRPSEVLLAQRHGPLRHSLRLIRVRADKVRRSGATPSSRLSATPRSPRRSSAAHAFINRATHLRALEQTKDTRHTHRTAAVRDNRRATR